MSSEGHELQAGLEHAGWRLAGLGFDSTEMADVPTILDRHKPEAVLIQDCRDWLKDSGGCFDHRVHFNRYDALRLWPGFTVTPLKDAASAREIQERFFLDIDPDALVVYYHPESVRAAAPWLSPSMPMLRTYHSVDRDVIDTIDLTRQRRRGLVSGALGSAYPLRSRVFQSADALGLERLRHPGYGNRGTKTPDYLRYLANFKVSIATASRYGFALRKIIEGVACGCTVITDLPVYDVLPEIDGALVRVSSRIQEDELRAIIDAEEREWSFPERLEWSRRCVECYDYRASGQRLSAAILEAATKRAAA